MKEIRLAGHAVELRPLEAGDAEALYRAALDPGIWTYMPRQIVTMDDMHQVVEDALEAKDRGTEYPFVIVAKTTEQVVGSTRFLDISMRDRHLEIGWTWLSPQVWRSRINTECKYLLLKYSFEELNTVRVQLKTDGRNIRSQKAIERLGAVKEGVLRKHRMLTDGYIRDSVYYSILNDEWPAVRTRLEQILSER